MKSVNHSFPIILLSVLILSNCGIEGTPTMPPLSTSNAALNKDTIPITMLFNPEEMNFYKQGASDEEIANSIKQFGFTSKFGEYQLGIDPKLGFGCSAIKFSNDEATNFDLYDFSNYGFNGNIKISWIDNAKTNLSDYLEEYNNKRIDQLSKKYLKQPIKKSNYKYSEEKDYLINKIPAKRMGSELTFDNNGRLSVERYLVTVFKGKDKNYFIECNYQVSPQFKLFCEKIEATYDLSTLFFYIQPGNYSLSTSEVEKKKNVLPTQNDNNKSLIELSKKFDQEFTRLGQKCLDTLMVLRLNFRKNPSSETAQALQGAFYDNFKLYTMQWEEMTKYFCHFTPRNKVEAVIMLTPIVEGALWETLLTSFYLGEARPKESFGKFTTQGLSLLKTQLILIGEDLKKHPADEVASTISLDANMSYPLKDNFNEYITAIDILGDNYSSLLKSIKISKGEELEAITKNFLPIIQDLLRFRVAIGKSSNTISSTNLYNYTLLYNSTFQIEIGHTTLGILHANKEWIEFNIKTATYSLEINKEIVKHFEEINKK